ncbi:transporter, partial [Corallococcus sicarius]
RWPLLVSGLLASAVHAASGGEPAVAPAGEGDEGTREAPEVPGVYRPTTSGPFVTFTAPLTPHGKLVSQPILSVASARGTFDARGRHHALAEGEGQVNSALSLFTEYGVAERFAAGVQLTLVHNRASLASDAAASTGLSDTLVFARATVLDETPGGPPEMTVLAQVKLPTGRAESQEEGLLDTDVRGTGSTDLTVGVDLTRGLRPFLVHLDLLYTHALPTRVDGVATRYGGTFSWSASGEWPFRGGTLALMLETSGRHQGLRREEGRRVEDSRVEEVLLGGGVEFIFSEDLQLLVGYQRTLWGRNVTALDAVVLTLVPVVF